VKLSPIARAASPVLADLGYWLIGVAWLDLTLRAQLAPTWEWVHGHRELHS
jgi:hypothetical protein